MTGQRGIVPLGEGDDGELTEVDEPMRVGGRVIYPSGKITDAETGEALVDASGRVVANVQNERTESQEIVLGGVGRSTWPGGGGGGVTVGATGGHPAAGDVMFEAQFEQIITDLDYYDPDILHRRHFSDGKYRVVFGGTPDDATELHTTTDFVNFSQVSSDILPNVSGSGQVAGLEILNDGTRVFLVSTGSTTDIYTGSSLSSLSRQGEFCPEPDGGTFYDRTSDTLHYFPEDSDYQDGVSSDKLSHWTASGDDLLNATQQSDAIDVTGKSWKTGDPDVIQFGGSYWMFFDNTSNHPTYNIALAKSNDLYNWTIVADSITNTHGGDMVVTEYNGLLKGMTEYTQDADQVGTWTLTPHTSDNLLVADTRSSTPSDHLTAPGQAAIYVREGTLYAKPDGGTETEIATGGTTGGAGGSDGGTDGSATTVEDFESGSISAYSGDTASFSTQTSTVHGGTYALEGASSSGSIQGIYDTDHSPSPAPGDTFEAWVRPTDGSVPGVNFGVQSEGSGWQDSYFIVLHTANGEFNIGRHDSGSGVTTSAGSSVSVSYSTGSWYRIEVVWTSSDISATLYDAGGSQVASTTWSDSRYSSGGIGFHVNSPSGSPAAQFDDINII